MTALVAPLPDGAVVVDASGRIVAVNGVFVHMTGFEATELVGIAPPFPFWSPDNGQSFDTMLAEVKRSSVYEREVVFLRKRGTPFIALITPGPVESSTGEIHYLALVKNVSPRKKEEVALRRSQENLRLVMDTIPQRLFWKDRNFRYLGCNQRFAEDAGLRSPDEIVGKTDFELSWKEIAPLYRSDDRDVMESGITMINYEEPQLREDGERLWLRTSKIPMRNETGEVIGVFGSYEDITDYKLAEEALRDKDDKYRTLVDQAMDGILLTDVDGNNIEANNAALEIFGYDREEFLKLNIRSLIEKENLSATPLKVGELLDGVTVTTERVVVRKDNTVVPVEIRARRLADGNILGFIRDISKRLSAEKTRRFLESQLRQSQKMEAMGTLAGGVAHDFNNILLAISGYAELIRGGLAENSPSSRDIEQLLAAADRGRQLIKRLLAFSRSGDSELKPVLVSGVVEEVLPLLRETVPRTIEIRVDIQHRAGYIIGDENMILQVLLNLVTNAAHAIQGGSGVLEIVLKTVEIASDLQHQHGVLGPGKYHLLCVSDTGHGIDPAHSDRIFDPFFTTKEVGKGTGLGLSVVHGIVAGLGGGITVQSGPGRGTQFDVFLPYRDSPAPVQDEEPMEGPVEGTGRVLLVDDEPQLTDLGTRMLSKSGYDVMAFTNPADAFNAFKADPNAFDVVITDYTMPGQTGLELARKMLELRSELPVILVTGFSDDVNREIALNAGLSDLLMKPFRYEDLARTIAKVLA